MSYKFTFLVHTRSRSFDYAWIYGLRSRSEEARIGDFLLNWLSATQLEGLPTVVSFFRLEDRFILLSARKSSRVDNAGRAIFERSMFSWKEQSGLTYRNVRSLYYKLVQRSEEVFRTLPNEEVRAPKDYLDLDFDFAELSREDSDPDNGKSWSLPGDWRWEELMATTFVLETPPAWDLPTLLAPVLDFRVDGSSFFVGSCLPLNLRFGTNVGWVVSPPEGGALAPRFLVEPDKLPHHRNVMPESRVLSSNVKMGEFDGAPSEYADNVKVERRSSEVQSLLESIADRGAETGALSLEGASNWMARNLGLGRERATRDALRRLFLLIPIELGEAPGLVLAWTNLMNEIALMHSASSRDIEDHWIQRLKYLQEATFARYGGKSKKWDSDFRSACKEVIDFIGMG